MPRWIALTIALCFVGYSANALAWLSLAVRGDDVTVRVEPDGSATVTHDLMLRVRGGPMKSFTIHGVDPDAEFFGEATLTRAKSGQNAGAPMALIPSLEGEDAKLELVYKKGVYTGSYRVHFAYRTQLKARGLVQLAEDEAELSWRGPVFDDGIDSLRVTFDLPRGQSAPHLPGEEGDQIVDVSRHADGVFLTESRREGERDVFVLTRPHVAKDERVTWRVRADQAIFGMGSTQTDAVEVPAIQTKRRARVLSELWPLGLSGAFAASFTLLMLLKARSRRLRFLIPLRTALRAPLVFVTLLGSGATAIVLAQPSAAALLLCLACLLAIQLPKHRKAAARGPGKWRLVDFEALSIPNLPRSYTWLDVGHPIGFLVFCGVLGGGTIMGLRLLGSAPYYSAMTFVYCSALVPLFCSFGAVPRSALFSQRQLLVNLQEAFCSAEKKARAAAELAAEINIKQIARYVDGCSQPDELRLRLDVPEAKAGLLGFELGLERHKGPLGAVSIPVAVVRVRESSIAHGALPRNAQWSRGRQPDERVALLRPALPSVQMTLDLVRGLLGSLQVERQQDKASSKASKQPRQVRRQRRTQLKGGQRARPKPAQVASVQRVPAQPIHGTPAVEQVAE